MNGLSKAAREELEALRLEMGGSVTPAQLLEHARNPNCALHRYFQWDDSEAAEAYRLLQARSVIRAVVKFIPNASGNPVSVRAYVSLPSDRDARTGYRAVAEVMDDEAMAAEALEAFSADLVRLQARYAVYASIRPTIAQAIDAARAVLVPA
jgi:hypothetical protein